MGEFVECDHVGCNLAKGHTGDHMHKGENQKWHYLTYGGKPFKHDESQSCNSKKNGTRCGLPRGHADAHKADTGSEIIDWHDSDATDPKAGVEPDEERPRLTVIRDPYPHERGGGGNFAHMLFYRWQYRGARNRVVKPDD